MGPRKRLVQHVINVAGGGGGGPAPTGNFAIGPDFGSDAGSDGITFAVETTNLDLESINLSGIVSPQTAVSLPSLVLAYDVLSTAVAGSLDNLSLSGGFASQAGLNGSVEIDIGAAEDMYLNEGADTTSYGSVTNLLSKTAAVLSSDETVAYVAFDLTGFTSGSIQSGSNLQLYMSTSTGLGENATLTFFTHPTKPFEEDTATWDNTEPPPGTSRGTGTAALTTTGAYKTITIPAAAQANMLGNWMYVRIPGTAVLGLNTITTQSKEAANPPILHLEILL